MGLLPEQSLPLPPVDPGFLYPPRTLDSSGSSCSACHCQACDPAEGWEDDLDEVGCAWVTHLPRATVGRSCGLRGQGILDALRQPGGFRGLIGPLRKRGHHQAASLRQISATSAQGTVPKTVSLPAQPFESSRVAPPLGRR